MVNSLQNMFLSTRQLNELQLRRLNNTLQKCREYYTGRNTPGIL